METLERDESFMREALAQAQLAARMGEVPIGAVVVAEGRIIARAHNRRELDQDPSAHAEFAALCEAARVLGRWRLGDCTIYVTLEPCAMCAGLMVNARVGRCVYGAADAKAGALGSLYDLNADGRLNHTFAVRSGVLADECSGLLSGYFIELRDRGDVGCCGGAVREADAAHAEAPRVDGAASLAEPRPRRVLLAMDSFKGSATSEQVEAWTEGGVRRVWPDARVTSLPLADGGEGTLAAIAATRPGAVVEERDVTGPLGLPVRARLLLDREHGEAVVEMAQAAGIGFSSRTKEAALAATTLGVGELVQAALDAGARDLYIGLGGSATSDGGAGLLQVLGARVLDAQGRTVEPGLVGLERVASIDLAPALERLDGAHITVLSDVTAPLVGHRGAVAVFGGQKGLPADDPARLAQLDGWMLAYGRALDAAIRTARDRGLLLARTDDARAFSSVIGVPGAGAAGGLGAALLALGGRLVSGIETVLDLVGFDTAAAAADLVITGEGNMDAQTAAGKAPVGVARRAKRLRKPVVAIVGGRADDLGGVYDRGIDLVIPVCRRPQPLEEALDPREAHVNIACAAESAARAYDLGRVF